MAERDAARDERKKTRSRALISGAAAFVFAAALVLGGFQLLLHPQTPLPQSWNPAAPLAVSDPVTPITGWKLSRVAADQALCAAAVADAARALPMAPLEDSEQCFIADRVALSGVGQAGIAEVETSCAIALRLAMWERHVVQPVAQEVFGQGVSEIEHLGSYNCRQLRTSSGLSGRMSTHATASAIDIVGFQLADGQRIRLLSDWDGETRTAGFLRRVRDGACDWFGLTLSPDFNRLHADHFHLQSSGWGGCR
jgi:hypothetical protein